MDGKQSSALPGDNEPWGPGPASQGAWQKPATFCCPLARASTHVLLALSRQVGGPREEDVEEGPRVSEQEYRGEREEAGQTDKEYSHRADWHPGFCLVAGTGLCTLNWGHSSALRLEMSSSAAQRGDLN